MNLVESVETVQKYWKTFKGLVITVLLLISLFFSLFNYLFDLKPKEINEIYYFFLFLGILITVFYWLIDTKKIILPITKTLRVALVINVDEKDIGDKVLKIVKPLVKEINISKKYSNIYVNVLPINIISSEEQLSTYLDHIEASIDTLIYLKVASGKENNSDKFNIVQFSFTGKFNNGIKKVYKDSVNIMQDLSIRNHVKNWEYIEADSYNDKAKLKNNLKDLILYYSGIYLILQSREEDALKILRGLYNKNETIVKANKKVDGKIELKISPQNIVSGRLTHILVNLLIEVGLKSFIIQKDRIKALNYLTEAEKILDNHEILPNIYIPLARLWYENGDLNKSKEYTDKLEKSNKYASLVSLNRGFYAIINNDKDVFIRNYKKLLNRKELPTNAVEVISFLDGEIEKYPSSKLLFELAEAVLTKLFIESDIGNTLLKEYICKYDNNIAYKELKSFAYKILKLKIDSKLPEKIKNKPKKVA